jgi:glycosyltransferase involved in cell wall biosynthesis
MKINFVTNIEKDSFGGGWSGMNYHVSRQLSIDNELNYIHINPPTGFYSVLLYKALKFFGIVPFFPTFTRRRLELIRKIFHLNCQSSEDTTFFLGSTSWIKCEIVGTYFAYLDADFKTYLSIYHKDRNFNRSQLTDIYYLEREFLDKATCVFFSSKYAMSRTKKEYNLIGNNFEYVGLGSGMNNQVTKNNIRLQQFIFVGIDFVGKGGELLIEVFEELGVLFPEAKLVVVGCSSASKNNDSNVEFVGYLDKSKQSDLDKLIELYETSLALVLPTSKDLTPLVICEAASFNCTTISIEDFGIQEMIIQNETGILIKNDSSLKENLKGSIKRLLIDKSEAMRLGINAFEYMKGHYNWDAVGHKLRSKIRLTLNR